MSDIYSPAAQPGLAAPNGPTSQDILQVLSNMAPRDSAAPNPANTEAMARSRDAITRILERQLKRQEDPFTGLNDVATAAQTALVTRSRTPFGAALEALDTNRSAGQLRTATALGQQAARESSAGGKAISPYQSAQLMMQNLKFQASRGDKDAQQAEQAIDNIRTSLEPEDAVGFVVDAHAALQDAQRRKGSPLSGQESVMVVTEAARNGRYRARQPNLQMQFSPFGDKEIFNPRTGATGQEALAGRNQPRQLRPSTSPHEATVERVAQQLGVPPDLAKAVARAESNYDPLAVSPKGAVGIMQLMPETARGLGVDPTNPDQNINGGVRYLKQMLDKYQGNQSLALMAYNWGPQNVDNWLRAGGRGAIPAETSAYVARILGGQPGPVQQQAQVPQPTAAPVEGQQTGRIPLPTPAQGIPALVQKDNIKTLNESQSRLDSIIRARDAAAGMPEALGWTGYLIDSLGGAAQQLERAIGAPGALGTERYNVNKVSGVRDQLNLLFAKIIPTITGDQSGRYSNFDVQLAITVARFKSSTSSPEQAIGFLNLLRDAEIRALRRQLAQSGEGGQAIMQTFSDEVKQALTNPAVVGPDGDAPYDDIKFVGTKLYVRLKGTQQWAEMKR